MPDTMSIEGPHPVTSSGGVRRAPPAHVPQVMITGSIITYDPQGPLIHVRCAK